MSKIWKMGKPYFEKQDFENEESQVKKWIKEVLNEYNVYYFMPVQGGYGATGLDFHCVVNWCSLPLAFFIEAKEFGKEPTPRQDLFIKQRRQQQKARTFVIDGMVGVNELRAWLEKLKQTTVNKTKQSGATDGHSKRV
jgi:hypothetical protein